VSHNRRKARVPQRPSTVRPVCSPVPARYSEASADSVFLSDETGLTPEEHEEKRLLSTCERQVLRVFQKFLVTDGQMLCFYGPTLAKYEAALRQLTKAGLVVKERFKGGYSLTRAGFEAMRECDGSRCGEPPSSRRIRPRKNS
jgi:hypothetical protein